MFLPPSRGSAESVNVQEAYELVEAANEFFVNGDYKQAITLYEKAIPVLRDVDDEYVLRCEYGMALCFGYLGRADEAITLLLNVDYQNQQYDPMVLNESEVADLFKRLSHFCLVKWKRLRQEDSNSLEAESCAEDAKLYLQKYLRMCQGDYSRQLDAYRRFAAFFYSTGDYQSASSYYNQALQMAERLHSEPTQLHCLTCIANSLVALGRLAEAIDTYKTTLDLAMKIQADKTVQAQCTYRLGCALLLTRRYSDAILYFLAHERIASDLGDFEGRLHSLDRLISAYREIGDYNEANKYSQHKDLLISRLWDSGTNEMASYIDQTLRSNISAVEQPSQLSEVQSLPNTADSFDNLTSKTFDSGQGFSGQDPQSNVPPKEQMYSFAFIDDGPSSVADLCDSSNKPVEEMREHDTVVVKPPTPPQPELSQNNENVAPVVVAEKVEEKPPHKEESSTLVKKSKHHKKQHGKRAAPTLPPEDAEFFDMLTRASTRRLDDQRCQLKPIPVTKPLSEDKPAEKVSAIVDVHANNKNLNVAEEQRNNPQPVTRTASNAAAADDLFLIVCKAQARRLDDQRAVLRPITLAPNVRPADVQVNVRNDGTAVRFVNNNTNGRNEQKELSSPTSISLIQPLTNSASKSSKARRFLSQLMK